MRVALPRSIRQEANPKPAEINPPEAFQRIDHEANRLFVPPKKQSQESLPEGAGARDLRNSDPKGAPGGSRFFGSQEPILPYELPLKEDRGAK
jgi:hypothetical protein